MPANLIWILAWGADIGIGISHGTRVFFAVFPQDFRFSEKAFFGRFVNKFMKVKNLKIFLKVVNFLSLRVRLLVERMKDFKLRVFFRVKMLNILGNLRVAHQ